ncbi:MAG: hypothetical protein WC389_18570 [Lutibacter sp.]|jgi:hypothetical protein
MENSILIEGITAGSLREIVKAAVVEGITAMQPKKEDNFLTRMELAKKLHISTVTLDKASRNGKLKGYRINGRVLFKESEINLSEIPIRKHR